MAANRLKVDEKRSEPLSVSPAAQICRVSKKTMLNWIYAGKVKAYRTEGGHYRIWPSDLKEFLIAQKMDVDFQFVDVRRSRAVFYLKDKVLQKEIMQVIEKWPNIKAFWADNTLEATFLTADQHSNFLFINALVADDFHFMQVILKMKRKYGTRVVFLGEPGELLLSVEPKIFNDQDVLNTVNRDANAQLIEATFARFFH